MRLDATITILRWLVAIYIGNGQAKKILLLVKEYLRVIMLRTGFTLFVRIVFFRLILMAGVSLFMAVYDNDKLTQYKGHQQQGCY